MSKWRSDFRVVCAGFIGVGVLIPAYVVSVLTTRGDWIAVEIAVAAGCVAAVAGFLYGSVNGRSLRHNTPPTTIDIASSRMCAQRRAFVLAGTVEHAVIRCADAVQSTHLLKVVRCEPSNGLLVAQKQPGMRTWGDRIDFSFESTEDGGTLVNVVSRPIISTTLIDYGTNRETVEALLKSLGVEEQSLLLRPAAQQSESLLTPAMQDHKDDSAMLLHVSDVLSAPVTTRGEISPAKQSAGM